jgi:hypothetical protein
MNIVTDHTQLCMSEQLQTPFRMCRVHGIAQLADSSLNSFSGRVLIGSITGTEDCHL